MNNLFYLFNRMWSRDRLILAKSHGIWLNPLLMCLIITTMFVIALGSSSQSISTFSPGILWVANLLAVFSSLENIFKDDFEDGTWATWFSYPYSRTKLVIAKLICHWLVCGLPLAILSLLIALMLNMKLSTVIPTVLGIAVANWCLIAIGSIACALTISMARAGVLLAILILPTYVPVLIAGCSLTLAADNGMSISGFLAILGAFALIALALVPFLTAQALKLALD